MEWLQTNLTRQVERMARLAALGQSEDLRTPGPGEALTSPVLVLIDHPNHMQVTISPLTSNAPTTTQLRLRGTGPMGKPFLSDSIIDQANRINTSTQDRRGWTDPCEQIDNNQTTIVPAIGKAQKPAQGRIIP